VFAAEPLDRVTSMLGGGETTQRTLFVGCRRITSRSQPFQRFCRFVNVVKLLKQFRDPRGTKHPSEEGV
jgi:hypothetical protein